MFAILFGRSGNLSARAGRRSTPAGGSRPLRNRGADEYHPAEKAAPVDGKTARLSVRGAFMKRSEVNEIVRRADDFIRSFDFKLPPFADWTPDEFRRRRDDAGAIVAARLGWDVTDFGRGAYDSFGLTLFTLRNGNAADLAKGRGMLYAEKLLLLKPGQLNPTHRHNVKAEDIIVRGGGRCAFELFMSNAEGWIDRTAEVRVRTDGIERRVAAGGVVMLAPGESITLLPGVWHRFWAEDRDVLLGEVSTVNDDVTDNVFNEPIGRFSEIDEDEAPYRLLVSDYERFLGP